MSSADVLVLRQPRVLTPGRWCGRGVSDGLAMSSKRTKREARQAAPAKPEVVRPWKWFRLEPGARSPAEEEFQDLPAVGRAGLAAVIARYRRGETRTGDVKPVADGILELRHRSGTLQFRVLFIHWGRCCVGLTAFCKKEQKTPRPDLDRAKQRAARWRAIHGETSEE